MAIKEDGVWLVSKVIGRVQIESDDFRHDAVLHVTGDFESDIQCIEYAEEIARRLNNWQKAQQDYECLKESVQETENQRMRDGK